MSLDFTDFPILSHTQIKQGLSEEDFQQYAGIPVIVASLSDFPAWDAVRTLQFDHTQYAERTQAIYRFFKRRGFAQESGGQFNFADAQAIADKQFATVQSKTIQVGLIDATGKPVDTVMPANDTKKDFKVATYSWWNSEAFTNIIPFNNGEKYQVRSSWRKTAAVICTAPIGDVKRVWGDDIRIDAGLIAHFPHEGMEQVLQDLHEARHLRQLRLDTGDVIPSYYAELDSDAFAHRCLRSNNVGAATINANLKQRYIGALHTSPSYWIAPALEAIENKTDVPTFYEVYDSIMEIRLRLAWKWHGMPYEKQPGLDQFRAGIMLWDNRMPPTSLQGVDAIDQQSIQNLDQAYLAKIKNYDRTQPDKLLGSVSELVNSGVLGHKLTRQIAHKIVTASEYFVPGVTGGSRGLSL